MTAGQTEMVTVVRLLNKLQDIGITINIEGLMSTKWENGDALSAVR